VWAEPPRALFFRLDAFGRLVIALHRSVNLNQN
jgi:hypothetical protein